MPVNFLSVLQSFKGAYIVFGMMIIGITLCKSKLSHLDFKFLVPLLAVKFLLWPIVMVGLIHLDKSIMHLFNPDIYQVLVLMSLVPIASNSVALASALEVEPLKTSVAVTLSTVLGLVTIPISLNFVLSVI